MVTLLLLLLVGVMAMMIYLIYMTSDLPLPFYFHTRKKKIHSKKEMPVKRMPTAVLVVYYAQGIREYPIADTGDGFCVGSDDGCDLKISKRESEYIDGEHALISLDDDLRHHVLTDLDSLNGIYDADHQRVESLTLKEGMQFWIADVMMEYRQYDPFEKLGV